MKKRIKKILKKGGSDYAKFLDRVRQLQQCHDPRGFEKMLLILIDLSSIIKHAHHTSLIDVLLADGSRIFWTSKHLESYISLLVKVVYVDHAFFEPVIGSLVMKLFLEVKKGASEQELEMKNENIHKFIKRLLKVSNSRTHETLVGMFRKNFPSKTCSINQLKMFVRNILKVTFYSPRLTYSLLEIIIDNLIKIDLEVKLQHARNPKSEIEFNQENVFENDEGFSPSPTPEIIEDVIFNIELDEFFPSHQHEAVKIDIKKNSTIEQDRALVLAEKVDHLMELLFEYLNFHQVKTSVQNVGKEARRRLELIFNSLQKIFFGQILKTYQLNSTQFLMFFICSLDTKFAKLFAERLFTWGVEKNPRLSLHVEVRRCCIAYLASFMARGKYLAKKIVGSVMDKLVDFCCGYICNFERNRRSIKNFDPFKHSLFYYVAQCVCYVMCYKVDEIVAEIHQAVNGSEEQRLKEVQLRFSKYDKIIRSMPLNVLKHIQKDIVDVMGKKFAYYKIADYSKLIMQNELSWTKFSSTTTIDVDGFEKKNSRKVLKNEYFPFDPYVLRRSRRFIQPIFIEFKGVPEDIFDDPIPEDLLDDRLDDDMNLPLDYSSGEESSSFDVNSSGARMIPFNAAKEKRYRRSRESINSGISGMDSLDDVVISKSLEEIFEMNKKRRILDNIINHNRPNNQIPMQQQQQLQGGTNDILRLSPSDDDLMSRTQMDNYMSRKDIESIFGLQDSL